MTIPEWFWTQGIPVFPTYNKKPIVPKGTSQFDYRCTREQAAGFREYGVPLGLLAVADSDTPEAETWVAANLPWTPFAVTTGPYHDGSPGRGRQRYFQLAGDAPHSFHREGLAIEFRHRGQYVVGPGSVRPDGVIYTPDEWSWRWSDIPFFPDDFLYDDGSCGQFSANGQPLVLPESIRAGDRHRILHKIMRSLVAHGVPLDGAMKACRIENQVRCRPVLEDEELDDAFLRRAYQQKDHADFVRSPKTGWDLCGSLIEVGLSVEAALVAVRSITPDFDPEHVDD